MSFFNEAVTHGIREECLERMNALRIDIDAECQYCDPNGVLQDKYERANEMLNDCMEIVKEVCAEYS